MSRKEQNITGFVVASIGAVLLIIEIIVILAMCYCCKAGAKTLSTKHQNDTNAPLINRWARFVPTAQPVYPQQQPTYAPQQQPIYAPQQQPIFAPQQRPAYAPQQSTFGPQQPTYYAQQTGYIPQYGYVSQ